MIKFIKAILLIVVLITFTNCNQKIISITNTYYINSKRVGVVFMIDSINIQKTGSQSLFEYIITGTKRFNKPLKKINTKINPINKTIKFYTEILDKSNKDYVVLDSKFNTQNLKLFKKPSKSKKAYYKYDIRWLKNKNIDELLIIDMEYGLSVCYDGIFHEDNGGYCIIDSIIINLDDNSYILNEPPSKSYNQINERWNSPPEYDVMTRSIESAIKETISKEKTKFKK